MIEKAEDVWAGVPGLAPGREAVPTASEVVVAAMTAVAGRKAHPLRT